MSKDHEHRDIERLLGPIGDQLSCDQCFNYSTSTSSLSLLAGCRRTPPGPAHPSRRAALACKEEITKACAR